MSYRIYLSPPKVSELEEEFVLNALRSGWVAPLGPHVDAFENEIAEIVGVENALALSSGTAGLHLALLVAGVQPGDTVIVPTMTFAATAFAVKYLGAEPIFIDSEKTSWNISPDLLEHYLAESAKTNKLPKAVIVVDVFGQTADYERIVKVCSTYEIPIIEDAAEALGATHASASAGSFGSAGVFSFNGNKIITTSGGGMLVSNDAEFIAQARYLATQARQPVLWYEHQDIGFNYRMSNVLAAIGRAQLQKLPEVIETRKQVRSIYTQYAQVRGDVKVLQDAPWGVGNNWLTVASFDKAEQAQALQNLLARNGIESRPVWKPMHQQPVFRNAQAVLDGTADAIFAHGLCLPSSEVSHAEEVIEIWDKI